MKVFLALALLLLYTQPVAAQTIAEKKDQLKKKSSSKNQFQFESLDKEMTLLRDELRDIYLQSELLSQAPSIDNQKLSSLLKQSQKAKLKLAQKEQAFRTMRLPEDDPESFSLMDENEISLEQLIIDYASSSHLYVIPPEMAKIQVNMCSSLPIPKAAWEEVVELICAQNGIGIKPLNSFTKSLYWTLGNNVASLRTIAHLPRQLDLMDPYKRICFVLSLEGSEFSKIYQFLKKFTNERLISLHPIGRSIIMVGEAGEIKEINKLIGFVRQHQKEKSYKLFPVDVISPDDVQAILTACFTEAGEKSKEECPIFIYPMKHHLLLMGTQKDIRKAENIIVELQSQISSPDQMSVHWYTCKFSEPAELATLLQQVYQMMVHEIDDQDIDSALQKITQKPSVPCTDRSGTIPPVCETAPMLTVNPPKAKPPQNPNEPIARQHLPNFIVDAKTGTIIMVVKKCYLGKLQELAKKLDVAKKMVQIEVLLFEKKIEDQTQFGLNVLQLGDQSTVTNSGLNWTVDKNNRKSPGILDYFFGKKKRPGTFPAFNFAYNFLISQDDIYVHSNPTITTVNQTPAVIDLIEEQSINMGTVEDPRTSTISNTFVRAQYGTFIQITPTVNMGDEEDDFEHYITLDTNVTFDTTTSSVNNRPNVNRRHIQNQVRIANGETLILGGLRRKNTEDHVDKIPFLGDIPGLGKLFSFTTLNDKSTEMFIFITPRVVEDPLCDFENFKRVDLKKRPGDSPELLKKLLEAKALEKEKKYRTSLKQLFEHA